MIYGTEHDPRSEGKHTEHNDDDAATIFAKLFLEQYQYNKRMREKESHEVHQAVLQSMHVKQQQSNTDLDESV